MPSSRRRISRLAAVKLILGSSSPFRRELLDRLGLDYECDSPEIDESRLEGETAEAMVMRLAEAKARAVAKRHPDALIIGSDQVAVLGEKILGKPGTHDKAFEQLKTATGQLVIFQTGLCLYDSRSDIAQLDRVPFAVQFRHLSDEQIEHYLQRERPYNCAGSFKSEGLGIALFERMQGEDPNALIGLPLIRLVSMLETAGVQVL
ncbi:MAG: Maf family nucleotide pyrophosphatase [Gammaproteobacteria bacterium]|nr:Maf family nucleotide pyrophosphatase [Gammaproteobacteria bacterium]